MEMKLAKFIKVVPKTDKFDAVCHEMYKRFGAAATNLRALVKNDADKALLVAQMHELRAWVREAFNQIKEMK